MEKLDKGYLVRFGASMLGYVVILIISITLLNNMADDDPVRYLVGLLPMIPLFFAFLSYLWYVRQVDEMKRRIQFEAVSIGMGLTLFITLTLSFLEIAGFPRIDMIWVPVTLIFCWGLGVAITNQRYK
jgi:hypothetical protein